MSGSEEASRPAAAAVPPIPPHFGQAGHRTRPEEPESGSAADTTWSDALDSPPEAPWWQVSPEADAAGMAVPAEVTPVFDLTEPPDRQAPSWQAPRHEPEHPGAGITSAAAAGEDEALVPDAILPPGTAPEQVVAPVTDARTAPITMPPPGAPPSAGRPFHGAGPPQDDSGGRRSRGLDSTRILLITGGVAGAVLIGSLAFAGMQAMRGSSGTDASSTAPETSTQPGGQSASQAPSPSLGELAPSIDSEQTDPRPLSLSEVFPATKIMLGGRPYKQDKTSVNRQCALAARGPMAAALQSGGCRGVVRATFVDGKKYAVTTGVAIMPTRSAAVAASKAGDPSRYEWFRGMRGKVAKDMDKAGGYASSTVRGRYIIYSYAQYADGAPPQATDPALKNLTRQFIAYAVRPIDVRGRQP
jgi:hypothetical protein